MVAEGSEKSRGWQWSWGLQATNESPGAVRHNLTTTARLDAAAGESIRFLAEPTRTSQLLSGRPPQILGELPFIGRIDGLMSEEHTQGVHCRLFARGPRESITLQFSRNWEILTEVVKCDP